MGNKKFSDLRFSWKCLFSVDAFIKEVEPMFKTGSSLPKSRFWSAVSSMSGGKNAITTDYLIVTNNETVSHVFIETKELYDFLADTEVKELSFAHSLAHEWPPLLHIGDASSWGPARIIVIHHQHTTLPSIKVIYQLVNPGTPLESFYLYVEDGDTFAGFMEKSNALSGAEVPDKYFLRNLNDDDCWDSPMYRYARVAMNFLLYEKCFPDNIVDGTPEDIANQNHYRRLPGKKTVHAAKEIFDVDNVTKKPHFRSGYFKLLSSEFYKKKRGQVVFVRSSFVHGHAKTALDDVNKSL